MATQNLMFVVGRHMWMPLTLSVVLVLFAGGSSYGEALYGISFPGFDVPQPASLFRIDPLTGTGQLVGTLPQDTLPVGLADSPGGRLFTFDLVRSQLLELSTLNGAILNSIDIGVNSFNKGEGSLAFAKDGTGYLALTVGGDPAAPGELYRFDVNSGTSELLYGLIPNFDGLDVSPVDVDLGMGITLLEGSLVGLNQAALTGQPYFLWDLDITPPFDSPLQFINPLLFETQIPPVPLAGFTFRSDGSLFTVVDDILFEFDADFNADPVGLTGFQNVSGLTFVGGVQFEPEPASIAIWSLLGLGGVGYACIRSGRQTSEALRIPDRQESQS